MPHPKSRGSRLDPHSVNATLTTMRDAANLRAAGLTYRQIGETLGIDYGWARELVIRALDEAKYEAADVMRTEEGDRLNRLQRAVWQDALNGNLRAIDRVLKIMERRARLFGLDAPQRVDATVITWNPDELDAEVVRLVESLGHDDPGDGTSDMGRPQLPPGTAGTEG